MQEDELYKLATDELNSRNRKADLWARACALATDDVDEARYLYTNLRVEELALEHNVTIGHPLDQDNEGAKNAAAEPDKDVTSIADLAADLASDLGTENTSASLQTSQEDQASTPAQIALARAELKGSDTFSVFETENSVDQTLSEKQLNKEESSSDGELPLSLAPAGEHLLSNDKGDSNSDLALGDLTQQADSNHDNTIHIDAEQNTASDLAFSLTDSSAKTGSTGTRSTSADLLADLMTDSSDQPATAAKLNSVAGAGDSDISSSDSNASESGQKESKVSATGSVARAHRDREKGTGKTLSGDAMVRSSAASDSRNHEESLVESDPDNVQYGIYADEDGIVTAVKQGGNNRSALMLTQVWFLSRRMWGMSLVYALMSLVLIVGLAILIPRCFAGSATMADFIVTAGFVGLALLGWFYLPYKFGNDWYEVAIRKKGYNLQAIVDAHSPAAAEHEYYMQYFSKSGKEPQLTN